MNILDTYGKRKNGRKEPQMANEDPPPRFLSEPIRPGQAVNVPRTNPRSERAAQAAQQWEEMENELRDTKAKAQIEINALRAEQEAQRHQLQTEIQELRGKVATLETANNILNTDCETLRLRGEANRARLESLQAKLEIAGKIILDLVEPSGPSSLTEDQRNEAQGAVEAALRPEDRS